MVWSGILMKPNNPFKHLIQQPLYRVQYVHSGEYVWCYPSEVGPLSNLRTKDWNVARAMDHEGANHYDRNSPGVFRVIRVKD